MPETQKGAKKPADRLPKAVEAAKAEAADGVITIEHNGQTYTMESDSFDDVETFELLGRMQMAGETDASALYVPLIVRRVLGDEQWQRFLSANRNAKGRVSAEVLGELFGLLDEQAGNQ